MRKYVFVGDLSCIFKIKPSEELQSEEDRIAQEIIGISFPAFAMSPAGLPIPIGMKSEITLILILASLGRGTLVVVDTYPTIVMQRIEHQLQSASMYLLGDKELAKPDLRFFHVETQLEKQNKLIDYRNTTGDNLIVVDMFTPNWLDTHFGFLDKYKRETPAPQQETPLVFSH